MYEWIPKPPLCPKWKFCQNHRWILFRYGCFVSSLWSYKGSNYQYQDTWYVIFDIFLWKRNWWSCDLWFFAHYQALPNLKSKQIIDMRIKQYDYLRISYKNGRSRIWFLPFLTSRSILYDKAQPLKATQLLDLYHGVTEPMALPAVAHGSKSQ